MAAATMGSVQWFLWFGFRGPEYVMTFGGLQSPAALANPTSWFGFLRPKYLATLVGLTSPTALANSTGINASDVGSCMSADMTGLANCSARDMNSKLQEVTAEMNKYLDVLTPFNHWIWAVATMLNEICTPFDSLLMTLDMYGSLGFLYTMNCCVTLMPVLCFTQHYSKDIFDTLGSWGANSFTGVVLAQLMWGLVRLVGTMWLMLRRELPRLQKICDAEHDACSKKVLLDYLNARSSVPKEEVNAMRGEMASMNFVARSLHIHRVDGPLASWARAHGTSTEAMIFRSEKLRHAGDLEWQAAMDRYWPLWREFC